MTLGEACLSLQRQPGPRTTRAALPPKEEKWGKGSHTLGSGAVPITSEHPFTSYNTCDMDLIVPIFKRVKLRPGDIHLLKITLRPLCWVRCAGLLSPEPRLFSPRTQEIVGGGGQSANHCVIAVVPPQQCLLPRSSICTSCFHCLRVPLNHCGLEKKSTRLSALSSAFFCARKPSLPSPSLPPRPRPQPISVLSSQLPKHNTDFY